MHVISLNLHYLMNIRWVCNQNQSLMSLTYLLQTCQRCYGHFSHQEYNQPCGLSWRLPSWIVWLNTLLHQRKLPLCKRQENV